MCVVGAGNEHRPRWKVIFGASMRGAAHVGARGAAAEPVGFPWRATVNIERGR